MTPARRLLSSRLSVLNVGVGLFGEDVERQAATATQVDWSPPAGGDATALAALARLEDPAVAARTAAANQIAVERIVSAQPLLTGFAPALDVVPGMTPTTILHAGPPIAWEAMSGPMKGAVTGALVFEGLARDPTEAAVLAGSGDITFSPCHDHASVGSMAGVTSASMYVHVVENRTQGNVAFTNLSEQLAQVLRMGANDRTVIDRLAWMRDVLGPMLGAAMTLGEPIDLRLLLSQALHMGDECHNRNVAGTTLLVQALAPYLTETDFSTRDKRAVFDFMASSDYFSGPTWMAAAKASLDAAHGIEHSSVVTAMARNGVEFGIRLSGTGPDTWFTGPAQRVVGPLFAGYTTDDAGLDIGDSAITETYGVGGFAMAAAPAIVPLVGGTVEDAIGYSRTMYEITTGTNPNVTIPLLDFRGVPTGIDAIKAVQTGVLPVINTAIAHRDPGIGMIGAGITHPPMQAFTRAVVALAETC